MAKRFSLLKELVCSKCGRIYQHDKVIGTCECGYPLLAHYDLDELKDSFNDNNLSTREKTLWRYHEILPVNREKNIVSLGEGFTPLISAHKMGPELGLNNLMIKDEGVIPTGTFKARGATVGISKCKELGIKKISMPTNGNAGAAWAAYAARAGIEMIVVMPEDAPLINRAECYSTGSKLYLVKGLISDAGAIVKRASSAHGLFDVSTLKEPYRIEGKKTMLLEIFEQMDHELPDVIVYPTGGGVGIIGMYKAMNELEHAGILDDAKTRFVAVQAAGCAPIVEAFDHGRQESEYWKDSKTVAFGINVPKALGDFLVLNALYKTRGKAVRVEDQDLLASQKQVASQEGIFMCPEGASTISAIRLLREDGWIDPGEKVVALNTGTGIKYPQTVKVTVPTLNPGQDITL